MTKRDSWDRLLWGVLFSSDNSPDHPMLLGEAWCPKRAYKGPDSPAPSRVLLFDRRSDARAWCRDARERLRHLPEWRFTPVRVRETVVRASP